MPPRDVKRSCGVCTTEQAKYTCPNCSFEYCSVSCYKEHKTSHRCGARQGEDTARNVRRDIDLNRDETRTTPEAARGDEEGYEITPRKTLRSLASLKWPTIPEPPAIPDPLDTSPEPLQLYQYTAIAQAPSLRELLVSKPRLSSILRSIDNLRGVEREQALEQVLLYGRNTLAQGTLAVWTSRPPWLPPGGSVDVDEEDMLALEQFAATVERILAECDLERDRKRKGLDWE